MSDVVLFSFFDLLKIVDKYPCDIPQQCSLFSESVFVLHPFLFLVLVGFAVIGLLWAFWLLVKYNFGVDLHE